MQDINVNIHQKTQVAHERITQFHSILTRLKLSLFEPEAKLKILMSIIYMHIKKYNKMKNTITRQNKLKKTKKLIKRNRREDSLSLSQQS